MKKIRTIAVMTILAMILACIPGVASAASKPGAPTVTKCSQSTTSTKTILKWKKGSGTVNGYEIYRKAGTGSYSKIKTVTSAKTLSYTTGKQTVGTSYSYKVRAYAKNGGSKVYGSYSKVKTVKIRNAKPKLTSAMDVREENGNVIAEVKITSDKNNANVLLDLDTAEELMTFLRAVGDESMVKLAGDQDIEAWLDKFEKLGENADLDQLIGLFDKGEADVFIADKGTIKYGESASAMKKVTSKTGYVTVKPGKTMIIQYIIPADSKMIRLKAAVTEDEYGNCIDVHLGSITAGRILAATDKNILDYMSIYAEYRSEDYDVSCVSENGKSRVLTERL